MIEVAQEAVRPFYLPLPAFSSSARSCNARACRVLPKPACMLTSLSHPIATGRWIVLDCPIPPVVLPLAATYAPLPPRLFGARPPASSLFPLTYSLPVLSSLYCNTVLCLV